MANLVSYIKKIWKDAPSTDTPINAENLNHMEDGIYNNATAVNQLGNNLTASDDLRFQFSKSGDKYGYLNANGNFVSFKTAHTGTYNATSRSAALDMGEDHAYRYVNTNSVPNTNSATYSVTSNGTKDMGATNNYRYVSVSVPFTVSSATLVLNQQNAPSSLNCSVGDCFVLGITTWSNTLVASVTGCTVLFRQTFYVADQRRCICVLKATSTTISCTNGGYHQWIKLA